MLRCIKKKSIVLFFPLKWIFYPVQLCSLTPWSCGHLNHTDFPELNISHYTVSKKKKPKPKITSVHITINLITKVSKYWEAVNFTVAGGSLPNSRFSLQSSSFLTAPQPRRLFTVKCRLTSFVWRKLPTRYLSLNHDRSSLGSAFK